MNRSSIDSNSLKWKGPQFNVHSEQLVTGLRKRLYRPLRPIRDSELIKSMPPSKIVAYANHSLIINLFSGTYHNISKIKACDVIDEFRGTFVCSKQENFPEFINDTSLVVWIKGFELTKSERKEGRVGNFAKIYFSVDKGKHSLLYEKLAVEIERHPQKKRQFAGKASPDEGFETIRFAIKGKQFKSLADGLNSLNILCKTFPKTTIRVHPRKVSVLVWGGRERKIMRKILKLLEGEDFWYIEYSDNKFEKEEKPEDNSILSIYLDNFQEFSKSIINV